MRYWIASALVGIALTLDTASYVRQIKKTLKAKKSSQVSSTAFLYKIAKALAAMAGLALCANYVGLGMELFMLLVYVVSLIIIARFKPKGWRLF